MSGNGDNNNNVRKLDVVRREDAERLKEEAERKIMDANYLRWIRVTANNRQILELRDELRAWRVNGPANHEAHETLQREYMTILRMLGYTLHLLGETGDVDELLITEENLNEIGGKQLNVEMNADRTGWYLQLAQGEDQEGAH